MHSFPTSKVVVAYGEVEHALLLEQPIEYSHMLHAGELKIACEYCHSQARRSIHAGVPETETCMNCHKVIPNEGRPELQKLTAFYESGEPIPWQKVHDLLTSSTSATAPRARRSSARRSRNMAQEMTVAQRVNTLQMELRLDCHKDHPKVDETMA